MEQKVVLKKDIALNIALVKLACSTLKMHRLVILVKHTKKLFAVVKHRNIVGSHCW